MTESVRLTLIVTVKALTVTTVTAVTILVRMWHLHHIQQWAVIIKSLADLTQQYLRFLQEFHQFWHQFWRHSSMKIKSDQYHL